MSKQIELINTDEVLFLGYCRLFSEYENQPESDVIDKIRRLNCFIDICSRYTHEEMIYIGSKINVDEFIKSIPDGTTITFNPRQ